jgi:hypothetical protein
MVGLNAKRGTLSTPPTQKSAGGGFQAYAAGNKAYGGGRPAPNVGMTANMAGYGRRDGAMQARRQAFLDRAKRFS